ncbi:MAG: hypothetical protein HQM16_19545 [Deltaproteobacteria bacterium]|nr:hypothetical protein [Deltaproteobacteria bacterium]
MKKIKTISWIFVGVCIGVVWACGSSTVSDIGHAVAEALGTALEVTYDNSSSGLSATTVQAAVDEVNSTLNYATAHGDDFKALLVGTWTGTHYSDTPTGFDNISMTLGSDGSFDCDNGEGDVFYVACDDSSNATWDVLDRTIQISFIDGDPEQRYYHYVPIYVSSTKLELSRLGDILKFTKSE